MKPRQIKVEDSHTTAHCSNPSSDTLKIQKRSLPPIVHSQPSENITQMHNRLEESSWIWKAWSMNWIVEAGPDSPNWMANVKAQQDRVGDHQKFLKMFSSVV